MSNYVSKYSNMSIESLVSKFSNNQAELENAIKSIQSTKCRLKKQQGKSTFKADFSQCLLDEDKLKQVRLILKPKKKITTELTLDDVEKLDYDETIKALRSIQSKKTLTKWLTDTAGDNDEYRNAERIEKMLKEHRNSIKPVDDVYIRKTDLAAVIETIETSGSLSQEIIIEMLKELL